MQRLTLAAVLLFLTSCEDEPYTEVEPTSCEPTVVEVPVATECAKDLPPEPAVPAGFPPEDEFKGKIEEAGKQMCLRQFCGEKCEHKADLQEYRACFSHWKHRTLNSSRNGIVKSKVDGSQIHDRDRPAAPEFYASATQEHVKYLNPETCSWHRIDENIGHTAVEHEWAHAWPNHMSRSKPKPDRMRSWLNTPGSHDMERFVARGPIDWPPAYMYRFFEDRCFDPAQFERNDVAAYGHAVKVRWLCAMATAELRTCSKQYIRDNASPAGRARARKRIIAKTKEALAK